jgi:hypothetical protein
MIKDLQWSEWNMTLTARTREYNGERTMRRSVQRVRVLMRLGNCGDCQAAVTPGMNMNQPAVVPQACAVASACMNSHMPRQPSAYMINSVDGSPV